jgi:RNA polymerase sigma factor (sigma-70 family)
MAGIIEFFLNKGNRSACAGYADHEALFFALEMEHSSAIQCLLAKITRSVARIGQNYRLSESDIEELVCDCVTICVQKIRTGQYTFQGYDPGTYCIEIAKNRVKNYQRRSIKHSVGELPESWEEPEDDPELGSLEQVELLEKILSSMSPNCQNLIRLKYLEGLRDKDVIASKLTQYSTVDALKNHRAQCMKKLSAIVASMSSNNTD